MSEEEMQAKFDVQKAPPKSDGMGAWCIPFEWGVFGKDTRITVAKAKYIAATLLASVAEAEKEEVLKAFRQERDRVKAYEGHLAERGRELQSVQQERNVLAEQVRAMKKARKLEKRFSR